MMTDNEPIDFGSMTFGQRLQTARTAMNMESKDAASHLRLNEKIILMMEKNHYTNEIAPIFMRGYLRSYAKLLDIPEDEAKKATDAIKLEPVALQRPNLKTITISNRNTERVTHHFMNIFTTLIVITLISLIATWWYSHNKPGSLAVATNQITQMLSTSEAPLPIQLAATINTPTTITPGSTLSQQNAPTPQSNEKPPVTNNVTNNIPNNNIPNNYAPNNIANKPAPAEPAAKFDDEDDLDSDM